MGRDRDKREEDDDKDNYYDKEGLDEKEKASLPWRQKPQDRRYERRDSYHKGDDDRGKGKGKDKDKGKGKGKKGKKGKKGDDGFRGIQYEPPVDRAGENGEWEDHRQKVNLPLLGELAPKNVRWTYVCRDEARRSFAGYLPRAFDEEQCRKFFEEARDGTDWVSPVGTRGTAVPRRTAWMVK